jgi:thiosulfate reductase cytochrome b subunit
METLGPHTFIVPLRFKNIAAFALARRAAWGLNTPAMFEDPWDADHITTWNFLPSLLRHIGVAPLWAVHVLYAVWLLVAIALVFTALKLVRVLRQKESPTQSSSAL